MRLVLHEPFKRLWAGRDAFAEVEQLQGEVFRELEARRTLRTEVEGRGYFVKIHRGVGWGEILKNWVTLKKPVLGADQEWDAIAALAAAGVPTMTAVAFGERGALLFRLQRLHALGDQVLPAVGRPVCAAIDVVTPCHGLVSR